MNIRIKLLSMKVSNSTTRFEKPSYSRKKKLKIPNKFQSHFKIPHHDHKY
jgi:hypothetical protein